MKDKSKINAVDILGRQCPLRKEEVQILEYISIIAKSIQKKLTNNIFILILFNFWIHQYQTNGQTFQKTYGGINSDEGLSITSSYNGNMAILGMETDSAHNNCLNIIKIDSSGNIIWKKKIKAQTKDFRSGQILATPDSGFIIVSIFTVTPGGSYSNLILIKLNNIGDTTWTKSYTLPYGNFNSIFHIGQIIVTSDGGYAITGAGASINLFFLKTDSTGNPMWLKYFNGYPSIGLSIKQDSVGNYYICGVRGPGYYSLFFVKTNSIGDTLLTRIFDKGYPGINGGLMDFTNDKGFIICANSKSHGELIKLDSLANLTWVKSYPSVYYHIVKSVIDGYLILASDTGYVNKIYLLKSDSIGNIVWARSYGGISRNEGIDLLISSNSIFVLGTTRNFSHGLEDVYLIGVDANGNTSCHEDSFIVSSSTSSLIQKAGCFLDSGIVVTNSLITMDTSIYDIYDACYCIPPVAYFNPKLFIGSMNATFIDFSTWADSWFWDFGDGYTSIAESPAHLYSYGTYYVCLTVTNSCGTNTYCDSIIVSLLGINEIKNQGFCIFPNPASKTFSIKNVLSFKMTQLQIIDPLGHIVYSEFLSGKIEYSIHPNLKSGLYFVKVFDGEKNFCRKLIIEND